MEMRRGSLLTAPVISGPLTWSVSSSLGVMKSAGVFVPPSAARVHNGVGMTDSERVNGGVFHVPTVENVQGQLG